MFTGIVSDVGKVLEKKNGDLGFTIACSYEMDSISIGGSIAHDGICLTVIEKGVSGNQNWYKVTVSQETINSSKLKNSLATWKVGSLINLERSLKVGDELGGHIVTGHVDGFATVTDIKNIKESLRITFSGPRELEQFIAKKGSIALDGISLTVNTVRGVKFDVNLIPHTIQNTTWNSLKIEDQVNIEIDPIARYVARLNELRT